MEEKEKKQGDQPQKNEDTGSAQASRGPLPEASVKVFISGLATQALAHLGAIENPVTGKRERDLEQAKYTIDLLQVIKDKTKGNLDSDESRTLDGCLYDLRMRYVEACR